MGGCRLCVLLSPLFVPDGMNSVGDYNLTRVGVVCLSVFVCLSVWLFRRGSNLLDLFRPKQKYLLVRLLSICMLRVNKFPFLPVVNTCLCPPRVVRSDRIT